MKGVHDMTVSQGQWFALSKCERHIVPGQGEDMGRVLRQLASMKEDNYRNGGTFSRVEHWGGIVAQLYYLAAEAYEQGAAASIGHNRSARYEEAAQECRKCGEALVKAASEQRDAVRAERMQAAFTAGYEDESAGDAPARPYSFDAREAYLVGKHYAREGMPVPCDVNSFRDKDGDWIRAGGCKYRVKYPGGKIPAATVTLEGPAE